MKIEGQHKEKTIDFPCTKKHKKSIEKIYGAAIEKLLGKTNENQISMTNQLAQQWVDTEQMVWAMTPF